MRKLVSAAVASLLLLGGSSLASPQKPAGAAPQRAAADMPPYVSAEGHFSVRFPGGIPLESSREIALRGGGASMLHQVWVELEDDSLAYMAIYNDYPADYANQAPQKVLAATRDGAAKGNKISSDLAIELNGIPGRAFTVSCGDGWEYTIHQFLAGRRLYQLIVVAGKKYPAAETEEFLSSFHIF